MVVIRMTLIVFDTRPMTAASGSPGGDAGLFRASIHVRARAWFWQTIMDTARGRGELRFVLQPLVSIVLGIRLGIADAKAHHGPTTTAPA